MVRYPKYLGLGLQRKGQNLDNVIVGWFTYTHQADGLALFFGGKDCKTPAETIKTVHTHIQAADAAWCFYSARGRGYYFADEYSRQYGRLEEGKGQIQQYDEDRPHDDEETYTRLAWDVHRLRQVELEWPEGQFTTPWKNFRTQLRDCEINDEPGRGPLKRILTDTQQEMQTQWVPAAAMAFQALRRGWAEYDLEDTGEEKELFLAHPAALTPRPLGPTRPMRQNEDRMGELDDPQYVYSENTGELIDYEAGEILY